MPSQIYGPRRRCHLRASMEKVGFRLISPALGGGAYNKKRNLGSQPYSLVVLPTKFLVGGFTDGHRFITSP